MRWHRLHAVVFAAVGMATLFSGSAADAGGIECTITGTNGPDVWRGTITGT